MDEKALITLDAAATLCALLGCPRLAKKWWKYHIKQKNITPIHMTGEDFVTVEMVKEQVSKHKVEGE